MGRYGDHSDEGTGLRYDGGFWHGAFRLGVGEWRVVYFGTSIKGEGEGNVPMDVAQDELLVTQGVSFRTGTIDI